jgi:hypothetical protein
MTKETGLALVDQHPDDPPPQSEPPASSAPPHPFRTSPWYDPAVHERERAPTPLEHGLRRRVAAKVLVILGGVALPVASLLVNQALEQVVALGPLGVTLLILAVVSTLANLLLLPTRKTPAGQVVLVWAPRSTLACALLLVGALVTALFWSYLALLFLPLAPVSVVLIVFLGLGLCGLCPYGALAIGIIQSLRAGRVLHQRLGSGATVGVVVGAVLLPLLLAGGLGVHARVAEARFAALVEQIGESAPFGGERMRLIAGLRGEEERVLAAYQRETDDRRLRTLAEVHHRLTDEPMPPGRYRLDHTLIRPWWFMDGAGRRSPLGFGPFEQLPRFLFGGLP